MIQRKHWEFWMVYGLGRRAPVHEHLSEELAANEARRLARENRGVTFFVLKAQRGYLVPDPAVEEVEVEPDEVPF